MGAHRLERAQLAHLEAALPRRLRLLDLLDRHAAAAVLEAAGLVYDGERTLTTGALDLVAVHGGAHARCSNGKRKCQRARSPRASADGVRRTPATQRPHDTNLSFTVQTCRRHWVCRTDTNLSRVLTGAHADTTQMSCYLHTPSRGPTTTARCSGRW
eukprot:5656713-Prymnesium_polylepis.2